MMQNCKDSVFTVQMDNEITQEFLKAKKIGIEKRETHKQLAIEGACSKGRASQRRKQYLGVRMGSEL